MSPGARALSWWVASVALVLATVWAMPDSTAEPAATAPCSPAPAAELVPDRGAYLGTNLDWGDRTLAQFTDDLGARPALAVSFTGFPLSPDDVRNTDSAVDQVAADGGMLLLTLEPHTGLAAVTPEATADLVLRLDGWNHRGVPVVVRFAHEMNGSWYAWGQQPAAYVAAFRRVADAVHAGAPGSAMMWAPNYGGGTPFRDGQFEAPAGSADARSMDTDADGDVTATDDPYAPYWPGSDAVDWVGMSLYHWGNGYPWGENEVPEPGKFVAQLTGTYSGLGGDDTGLPDFYAAYGEAMGKPVAIPETAALWVPGAGGAGELAVKQAWWRQVLDPALADRMPRLAMINWFEWRKDEVEVGGVVDWTATTEPTVRAAFRADLPEWARWAEDAPGC